MKHEKELFDEAPFNLFAETIDDPERLLREKQESELARIAIEKAQDEMFIEN